MMLRCSNETTFDRRASRRIESTDLKVAWSTFDNCSPSSASSSMSSRSAIVLARSMAISAPVGHRDEFDAGHLGQRWRWRDQDHRVPPEAGQLRDEARPGGRRRERRVRSVTRTARLMSASTLPSSSMMCSGSVSVTTRRFRELPRSSSSRFQGLHYLK